MRDRMRSSTDAAAGDAPCRRASLAGDVGPTAAGLGAPYRRWRRFCSWRRRAVMDQRYPGPYLPHPGGPVGIRRRLAARAGLPLAVGRHEFHAAGMT